MEVFISWSGELSKRIGEKIRSWLPKVLQHVDPYFTPEDIDKGALWDREISKKLETCAVGLFLFTPENIFNPSPWMHFEAGALAKHVEEARICSVLFQVNRGNLPGNINRYQITPFERKDFFQLISTLNQKADRKLSAEVLEDIFENWWPKLEADIKKIIEDYPATPASDPERDSKALAEVLNLTRSIARKLDDLPTLPLMDSPPSKNTYSPANDLLVGSWRWFTKDTVLFAKNGLVVDSKGETGLVLWTDHGARQFQVLWSAGFKDSMTLGPDNLTMSGKNQHGVEITGTKEKN